MTGVARTSHKISRKSEAEKMGGRRSGRVAGFGNAAKCEDYNSIDLAWLKRKKMLNPGLSSSIQWSRCGQEIGSIRIQTFDDAVRVIYNQKRSDGEWQPVDERIPLVRTATRFGGERRWFLCLTCRNRCRVLYGGAYFRCRKCFRLKYASQFEAPYDRAASQSHRGGPGRLNKKSALLRRVSAGFRPRGAALG
jgi:hypothetical protein